MLRGAGAACWHLNPLPPLILPTGWTPTCGSLGGSARGVAAFHRDEPGEFFAYPPGMAHYAYAEGETVVQLNSTGPWTITYVQDDEDPRM